MSISIQTDRSKHLTTFAGTGDLTPEMILKSLESFYTGENSPPTRDVLWDLREARLRAFSVGEAQRIVDIVRANQEARSRGKTAVVAPHDLEFGIARMLTSYIYNTSITFMVFRTIEQANKWLHLNELPENAEDFSAHLATQELNN